MRADVQTSDEHMSRAWMLLSVYSGLKAMASSGTSLVQPEAAPDAALACL
tara:strand:+ start:3292 stop:3441 length:150 start_codon:yes stop_codon:yes gene_type:complete